MAEVLAANYQNTKKKEFSVSFPTQGLGGSTMDFATAAACY
jgi:hypothetical protein